MAMAVVVHRPADQRAGTFRAAVLVAAVTILMPLTVVSGAGVPAASGPRRPSPAGFRVPVDSTQLIVGVAADSNANEARLARFERTRGGRWKPVGGVFRGRLGARGLAWGRGIHRLDPMPAGIRAKREGDDRSPAGVFTLGTAYGYATDVEHHARQPYVRITPYDLFVEDPTSPLYNTHVRLDHLPISDWERAQQMEQTDPSHALEVVINHNTAPKPIPGAGSAILFHIWRNSGDANTSGCTTMDPQQLRGMVAWINPKQHPLFVLLPQDLYNSLVAPWGLPASMASPPGGSPGPLT